MTAHRFREICEPPPHNLKFLLLGEPKPADIRECESHTDFNTRASGGAGAVTRILPAPENSVILISPAGRSRFVRSERSGWRRPRLPAVARDNRPFVRTPARNTNVQCARSTPTSGARSVLGGRRP